MRAALVCDVSFPVNPNGNDAQIRNMKRIPVPHREHLSIVEYQKQLHEALPKGKKYVIDVLCRWISQNGGLSDFSTRHPGAWEKLEEMRGR